MYRHLLVPIDNSELSTVTIGHAVEFALVVGARITFFHATAYDASSITNDAEIIRASSPDHGSYSFGQPRELLAKAESAARARGVPCDAMSATSDTPYKAIIAAARAAGCDLIFMASHGRRSTLGMMLGSQTLKVLMNSEIPVLVSATADPPAPAQAIAIIRDEHRSLGAVIHAWMHLFGVAESDNTPPDAHLMKAILRYIQDFPVALHHPKEDEYLFRKLRERTSEGNADLDELERQHVRDAQLVAELAVLVDRYAAGEAVLEELRAAVTHYAKVTWEHMGREEGVILPLAQARLTEEDWVTINEAFHDNQSPRFAGDTDAEYKRLFSRIVNLAS